MRHDLALRISGLLLALLIHVGVRAETTEDIVQLSQKGLGEDVLVAAIERSDKGFKLNADDIIRLKQANVPEKVIAIMLRKKPAADGEGVVVIAPQEGAVAVPNGTLNLENVDDKPWSYRLDAGARVLWISPAGEDNQKALAPHGGVSLSAPKGSYVVRYAGDEGSQSFNVTAGDKALLLFSRVETDEFEGLYVSVFEKGERRGGGRLTILRQTKKSAAYQAPARAREETTYRYEQPRTQVTERVVERVVEPSTTVIYRDATPTYVYPNYYDWYRPYYSSYYYPHHHHSYSHGTVHYRNGCNSRSGISIGLGFGW